MPRSIASNMSVRCSPRFGGIVAPHAASKLRAQGVVLDVLEAGQLVRQRAHVAAALHVVLAAQRLEPRAVAADVPDEQREVDQREDVVDGVVVLGDPERPADLRRSTRCAYACASSRIASAGTPVTRSASSSVHGSTDSRYAVEAGGRALDELLVGEPGRR